MQAVEPVPPATFDDVYRERYEPLVRLAFLLTAGNPAAEELVQDAFERAHQRWDRIDEPAAYLRVAVVNACTSWRRRAQLERETAPRLYVTHAVDSEAYELRDVIAALPPRQRAALVLRYYEDLSDAEIAHVLGCRVPAVKSLLHRALNAMRKVIEE